MRVPSKRVIIAMAEDPEVCAAVTEYTAYDPAFVELAVLTIEIPGRAVNVGAPSFRTGSCQSNFL